MLPKTYKSFRGVIFLVYPQYRFNNANLPIIGVNKFDMAAEFVDSNMKMYIYSALYTIVWHVCILKSILWLN